MLIYDYNSKLHKYKDVHDETGGRLKELSFQYYDCFCGCTAYAIVATTTRHHNQFTVVQCTDCGTLRINPYLSDSSIATYYREIYGPIKRRNVSDEALYERQTSAADELFGYFSDVLARDARILDYGGGAGGRMARLVAEGYNVYIHEYDQKYLAYALQKGLKPFSEGLRYDLIILRDVIEHINDPKAFLRYAQSILTPQGKLFIEVPMLENNRTLLGDLQLAHKFYFTQPSLEYLANLVGFACIKRYHNAMLITPDAAVQPSSLKLAKVTSDKELKRALRSARLTKPRAAVKHYLKKQNVA